MTRPRLLRFGVFELDLETGELRRRGRLVPLPPQPFAVLAELAGRSGHLVSREELGARLWADGVHVDRERGLNHCVNQIRRALGDDVQAPRFVETVPRQGYRFLGDVEVVGFEDRRGAAVAEAVPEPVVAASAPRKRRIAPWLTAAFALVLALQSADAPRRGQPGKATPAPPNAAAAAAYLEGQRLMAEGPAGWRRSIEHFREAARQDARFAPARSGMADAYMRLGEQGVLPAHEAFPAARRAALDALAIEDGAEPLVILAAVDLNYEWDWAASERSYRQALRLDPGRIDASLGYARLLSAAGRHAEALRVVNETETRHPGCSLIVRDAGLIHYRARRFDEAARRFRDWAALEPTLRDPHHWLALLHYQRGQPDRAMAEVRTVMALANAPRRFRARLEALPPGPAMELYLRGCLRYMEGLAATEWVTPDDFARLRALLGERERALSDLERAADERSPRLLPYLRDPVFDTLRSDERFLALGRRVRLPAARTTPSARLAIVASRLP